MIKKLVRIGRSLGFIIEKPILELHELGLETEFRFTTENGKLIFEPIRKPQKSTPKGTPA